MPVKTTIDLANASTAAAQNAVESRGRPPENIKTGQKKRRCRFSSKRARRTDTDGVYDGSDADERQQLEVVMQAHYSKSARDICTAVLEHASKKDDRLRQIGQEDQIDDKTVFIIKRE